MKEGTIYSGEVYLLPLRREKHGKTQFPLTREKIQLGKKPEFHLRNSEEVLIVMLRLVKVRSKVELLKW